MLCQECSEKPTCTELCERAERYSNRDYVYQRELPCPEFTLEYLAWKAPIEWAVLANYHHEESVNFPFLTNLQNKCLHLFYFEGFTYRQIASCLSGGYRRSIPANAVDYQLRKARKDILRFFAISREEY